ncbi:class I SAM-dependent methyltransferase [Aquimarina addita]|uniref:Class I SAM-dependent methyltransferase n=1 Tax=Aquimarina addita TaxID=870485 RepID=A0ABP7XGS3_9FLAO
MKSTTQEVFLEKDKLIDMNNDPTLPNFFEAGHFHSPIPDIADVKSATKNDFGYFYKKIYPNSKSDVRHVDGIELNIEAQLNLLNQFSKYKNNPSLPFNKSKNWRYFSNNSYFTCGDACVLHAMIRHYQPKNIIEVGSGFSSALMLDTQDKYLENKVNFTFIEPYQKYRLLQLLDTEEFKTVSVIEKKVQDVDLNVFESLEKNDILFIDSSHVAKFGSDVCHLIFNILPRLKPGVIVHFHDILWPFEYPQEWLKMGWAWNEAYILRSFLQYNKNFKILYFNSYLANAHMKEVETHMPASLIDSGGSLWLVKS